MVFVVAAVLRVGWVTYRYAGDEVSGVLEYPDEQAYCLSGRSLANGEGLVDEFGYRATYMPAYPAFIALFTALDQPLFWARFAQALLGALAAPMTVLLACRWLSLIRRAGDRSGSSVQWLAGLAGLAVAFDPFLVFFSGLLLTEALFATALVTLWYVILSVSDPNKPIGWRRAVLAGLMLFVCVMIRPSAVILVVLAPLAVLLGRGFDKSFRLWTPVMLAVVVVGLLPWAIRNRVTIGEWEWLTTRGGISLYDGLHEGATGASDLAHTKDMPEVKGVSETQWDSYFRAQAWAAVKSDPLRVIKLAWTKFLRTWNPQPNVPEYRHGAKAMVSFIWMLGVLVLAGVGWWIKRCEVRHWLMLLLPVIGFTLLHVIFVGSVRYRIPVMPMIMVLTALGLGDMLTRLRRGSSRR